MGAAEPASGVQQVYDCRKSMLIRPTLDDLTTDVFAESVGKGA